MANKNRTGFYPVGTLTGAPWSASLRRFPANTTVCNVCKGDLVELTVDGTVEPVVGASSNILGVVVGIEPITRTTTSVQASSLTLERTYIPKSTSGMFVRVTTDPFVLLQTVTANGTTIGTANVGEQYNVLGTAGGRQTPTTTPLGTGTLDVGNPQVNAVGQLVLMDIGFDIANDASNSTYAGSNTTALVMISSSVFKAAKATKG